MKRRIFWSVFFTGFFRLQIYEAIAAIFWQSASYVVYLSQFNSNSIWFPFIFVFLDFILKFRSSRDLLCFLFGKNIYFHIFPEFCTLYGVFYIILGLFSIFT